jgi:hypothetical protein
VKIENGFILERFYVARGQLAGLIAGPLAFAAADAYCCIDKNRLALIVIDVPLFTSQGIAGDYGGRGHRCQFQEIPAFYFHFDLNDIF